MHAKLFTRRGAIRADGLPQGGGAELDGRHKKAASAKAEAAIPSMTGREKLISLRRCLQP
jgi:hypothetical protein